MIASVQSLHFRDLVLSFFDDILLAIISVYLRVTVNLPGLSSLVLMQELEIPCIQESF